MEILKKHSKAITICAIVLVLIIVLFVIKVDPVNFNDLYSDLDEEYWCTIAEDGSWMKICSNDWYGYTHRFEAKRINEDLGFPSAVYGKMINTREVDGRLTAKGNNVKASWSHDGSELSILYEADVNAKSLFESHPIIAIVIVIIAGAIWFIFLRRVPEDDEPLIKISIRNDSENRAGQQISAIDGDTSCSEAITPERAEIPTNSEETEQQFSAADEILKFKKLLDMGVITQEEFEAKKKELLGL